MTSGGSVRRMGWALTAVTSGAKPPPDGVSSSKDLQRWNGVFTYHVVEVHVMLLVAFLCFAGTFLIAVLGSSKVYRIGLSGLEPMNRYGFVQDLSDLQWRDFRSSLPLLAMAAVAHLILRRMAALLCGRPSWLAVCDVLMGVVMVGVLHGSSSFLIYSAVLGYYLIYRTAEYLSTRVELKLLKMYFYSVLWIYSLSLLGVRAVFSKVSLGLLSSRLPPWADYDGMYPWHLALNFIVLRGISFATDGFWSLKCWNSNTPVELPDSTTGTDTTGASRVRRRGSSDYMRMCNNNRNYWDYSLLHMVAYCLYPPLYLAGPIATFNGWVAQQYHYEPLRERPRVLHWALSLVLWLVCIEVLTMVVAPNAVISLKENRQMWHFLSAAELYSHGVWTLIFYWLKFTVLWGFFRLWSLMDGTVVPDNLTRFICNHYSVAEFWRTWHVSYNLWLVRYMYIPLGGRHRVAMSISLVFVFVAVWHELNLALLSWCGLVVVGLLLEEFFTRIVIGTTQSKSKGTGTQLELKTLWTVYGTWSLSFLMTVNLVGFAFGPRGLRSFVYLFVTDRSVCGWVLVSLSHAAYTYLCFFVRTYESERWSYGSTIKQNQANAVVAPA
eukprot:Lankesteria_metandrocarpae@DN5346_c0_g1_i1.p1